MVDGADVQLGKDIWQLASFRLLVKLIRGLGQQLPRFNHKQPRLPREPGYIYIYIYLYIYMYRYIDTGKIYLYTYCMHVCIGTYVYLCIYEYVGIFSVYGVFVFVCV